MPLIIIQHEQKCNFCILVLDIAPNLLYTVFTRAAMSSPHKQGAQTMKRYFLDGYEVRVLFSMAPYMSVAWLEGPNNGQAVVVEGHRVERVVSLR